MRDRGGDAGTGGKEDVVVEGVETVGEGEVALSRLRLEKMAAVVAAPAAADIPATTANVALDILDYGVGRRFYAEQPANAQTYVLSGPERAAGIKLVIWTVSQSRVLQSSYWSSVTVKKAEAFSSACLRGLATVAAFVHVLIEYFRCQSLSLQQHSTPFSGCSTFPALGGSISSSISARQDTRVREAACRSTMTREDG